ATAESLMRVKIEPNWVDVDNPEISNIKIVYADNVVKKDLNSSENNYWYKYGDYLYYIGTVTDNSEMELVKGIQFLGGVDDEEANKYQGKNLKINVTLDMIQCKYAPFKTKWKETEGNITLYNKLKGFCPEADTKVEE
ncbi:MAG: hypothetical protein PUC84_03135, partial [Clostridiales bacterium]|nr:hypothetical protein [Clostridiales bacterium]